MTRKNIYVKLFFRRKTEIRPDLPVNEGKLDRDNVKEKPVVVFQTLKRAFFEHHFNGNYDQNLDTLAYVTSRFFMSGILFHIFLEMVVQIPSQKMKDKEGVPVFIKP